MADVKAILIVGAGIAGLSAARALRSRGFTVELCERRSSPSRGGAGLSVQGNAVRALRSLGLAGAVQRAGFVLESMSLCAEDTELLCSVDLRELWGDVGPCLGIERRALEGVLWDGAAGIPCRFGTSLAAIVQHEQGVMVRFTDGSERRYDLVVGADGIGSQVRALGVSSVAAVYSGQMVWRSVAPIRPSDLNGVRFMIGDGCFFGLCPVGAGRTYGFGNVTQPRRHDPLPGRLERLRATFRAFAEPVRQYLTALSSDDAVHCSAIEWLEEPAWRSGRVVLIGDAAHAASPMLGQGGAMALEDAHVLAECLSEHHELDRALEGFVSRRSARVAWVRDASGAVGQSVAGPPALRNHALRQAGAELLRRRYAPLLAPP